jgi:hypothetical protein
MAATAWRSVVSVLKRHRGISRIAGPASPSALSPHSLSIHVRSLNHANSSILPVSASLPPRIYRGAGARRRRRGGHPGLGPGAAVGEGDDHRLRGAHLPRQAPLPATPRPLHLADDPQRRRRCGRESLRHPRGAEGAEGPSGDLCLRSRREVHPRFRQPVPGWGPRHRGAKGGGRGVSLRLRLPAGEGVCEAHARRRDGVVSQGPDGVGLLRRR